MIVATQSPPPTVCTFGHPTSNTYDYSNISLGQSTTACVNGYVASIVMTMHNLSAGAMNCEIRVFKGEGFSGDLLYLDTFAISDVWGSEFTHILPSGGRPFVRASERFTIQVTPIGGYVTGWASFDGSYANGQGYKAGASYGASDFKHTVIMTTEP
jgi:hypothetical protein